MQATKSKVFYLLQRVYIAACGNCGYQTQRRDTNFEDAYKMITMDREGKTVCISCRKEIEQFEQPEGACVE